MRKRSTFLTLPGIVIMLLLLLGLGFQIWKDGGKLFSPGNLSQVSRAGVVLGGFASHADFENQCKLCHQPLQNMQAPLCITCHADIADQVVNQSGLHARLKQVESCAVCHSEHHGRDFDPTQSALAIFDHSVTTFSLLRHQVNFDTTPMACTDCHTTADFVVQSDVCANCHGSQNMDFMVQHIQDFGPDCMTCHDGVDRMSRFDHSATAFPLDGQHAQIACAACHVDGNFQGLPTACADCHQEPALHRGMFNPDCAACHSSQGWSPAQLDGKLFDHFNTAGFSLILHAQDYAQQDMTCVTCHQDGLQNFSLQTCVNCHGEQDAGFMKPHIEKFGQDCTSCHDGVDRMSNFDHVNFFPLDGRHADLLCDDCHQNQSFAGTPSECWQCHAEPEIHIGFFGQKCQNCHQTSAWAPAKLHIHDFPLDHGGRGESACETCHPNTYVEYTCYGCHDHQSAEIVKSHTSAGISLAELPNCFACHADGKIAVTPQP